MGTFTFGRTAEIVIADAGTANHVLWHAGHALWLQDHFFIGPLAGGSELPSGWPGCWTRLGKGTCRRRCRNGRRGSVSSPR